MRTLISPIIKVRTLILPMGTYLHLNHVRTLIMGNEGTYTHITLESLKRIS